jgi:hypothetical protein
MEPPIASSASARKQLGFAVGAVGLGVLHFSLDEFVVAHGDATTNWLGGPLLDLDLRLNPRPGCALVGNPRCRYRWSVPIQHPPSEIIVVCGHRTSGIGQLLHLKRRGRCRHLSRGST